MLVVWKLDRLGRSLSFLIELIEKLRNEGAGFESLSDGINTTSAGGKLVFHIMGALAEFERSLISERSKAGMQAARRRGKHIGRPHKLNREQINHAAPRAWHGGVAARTSPGLEGKRISLTVWLPEYLLLAVPVRQLRQFSLLLDKTPPSC